MFIFKINSIKLVVFTQQLSYWPICNYSYTFTDCIQYLYDYPTSSIVKLFKGPVYLLYLSLFVFPEK